MAGVRIAATKHFVSCGVTLVEWRNYINVNIHVPHVRNPEPLAHLELQAIELRQPRHTPIAVNDLHRREVAHPRARIPVSISNDDEVQARVGHTRARVAVPAFEVRIDP
jgi:hypothetical protein